MNLDALGMLKEVRSIRYAVLVDAQGQAVGFIGQEPVDAKITTTARAVIKSLQSTLQTNEWSDFLVDLDTGPLLLTYINEHILQVSFDDVSNLGRVRFAVNRAIAKL